MKYITSNHDKEDCIFCGFAASDPSANEEALILHRTEFSLVVLNKYPYNNGHLMIAPFRHVGGFSDLEARELADLFTLTAHWETALKQEYKPDGFNIGANIGRVAGAGVEGHIHIHLVPRWGGDSNFMTIASSTRVIPEELSVTYKRLEPYAEQDR